MMGKVLLLVLISLVWAENDQIIPEQVHIAFGSKINDIVVTWSTFAPAPSVVRYGRQAMDHTATGDSFRFQDGQKNNVPQWIHNVVLPDLDFDTHYEYVVGSEKGWHGNFTFKTPPKGQDWKMRIGLYGDLGWVRGEHTIGYLKTDVREHMYDMIFHVGDFAYDFNSKQGARGDAFMNKIEPIAANVPYMTCPGNHEHFNNFTHYKNRFTMPGRREDSSVFFSFDLGPVHFISISTEVYYYFKKDGSKIADAQYKWLTKDLAEANKEENRKIRPWVIIFGHRPMYCSNKYDDCKNKSVPHRIHLEKLLMDYGVDIGIWAHEHSYERTWPVYNYKTYNSSNKENPNLNPLAPIHVITGSAGCDEGNDPFGPKPDWSAAHSRDRGYTRFDVYNGTHIYMEQLSTEDGEKMVDTFWIVQEKHGPFTIQ